MSSQIEIEYIHKKYDNWYQIEDDDQNNHDERDQIGERQAYEIEL